MNEFLKTFDFNRVIPDIPQSSRSLNPYQISSILRAAGDALTFYLKKSQAADEIPDEFKISERKIQHISELFGELSDNFFPMAHTTTQLSELMICETRDWNELKSCSAITQAKIMELKEYLGILEECLSRIDR